MLIGLMGWFLAGSSARPSSPDLEELYASGIAYDTFHEQAEGRRERWVGNYLVASVPDDLLERARRVEGPIRILAIAVDGCSDSVNTIPYLARLVEAVDGLEMRIVDPDAGRLLMESHRTPDGRAATPTVLVLNAAFEEIGAFIERPVPLQDWALLNREDLSGADFLAAKFDWYDEDRGHSTMEEIIAMMEFSMLPDSMKGSFVDDYDIKHDIEAEYWVQKPGTTFHVVEWNVDQGYMIGRNGRENMYSPGNWTRIDWMPLSDMAPWTWAFCLTAYEAESAEAARATPAADRSIPRSGCGGHPFSRMKLNP